MARQKILLVDDSRTALMVERSSLDKLVAFHESK
jgi:hypothetical protein